MKRIMKFHNSVLKNTESYIKEDINSATIELKKGKYTREKAIKKFNTIIAKHSNTVLNSIGEWADDLIEDMALDVEDSIGKTKLIQHGLKKLGYK